MNVVNDGFLYEPKLHHNLILFRKLVKKDMLFYLRVALYIFQKSKYLQSDIVGKKIILRLLRTE